MSDTKKEEAVEVVYLGPVQLEGGKKGVLFIPRDVIEAKPDASYKDLWAISSPFGIVRGLIVGAAYKSHGLIEGDRVRRLGTKSLRVSGRVDHPALIEFELRADAAAEEDKAAAMERKIKAEPRIAKEVERLGALLAKIAYTQQAAAERAIMQAIRNAAREASRAKR